MTVWIHRRPAAEVAAEVAAATGPLAGFTVAVKDNIDVAGMDTTCACPDYAYRPARDAIAVSRLRAAGAVIVGKTNMDQFATGLVGTRSPYGAVSDVRRPEYVSGGSSSGSAAAVARGEVDFALGTDTAGSGRVPAAFGGIVGAKPSLGLVPTDGVVPACRSFDCVSVFARDVDLAERAIAVMAGVDCRPAMALTRPRLGVFAAAAMAVMSPAYRDAFATLCASLQVAGAELVGVDAEPFLAAGRLLYDGAFVAERYAAVGEFVADHPSSCDPTVAGIVLAGGRLSAADYVRDQDRLERLAQSARAQLDGLDGLLVPTAPFQPTIAAVAADPVEVNRQIGVFSTFCNLVGLCAYALPAGAADGGCFGVSVLAAGGRDRELAALARWIAAADGERIPLLVVGAHLSGMPLNHQLTDLGARPLGPVDTAADYRLYALDTEPAKPGLVRDAFGAGASIAGELWALSPAGLGRFLAALPQPMALGRVTVRDGREVVGFLCEPAALTGAQEITAAGGWRAHLGLNPV